MTFAQDNPKPVVRNTTQPLRAGGEVAASVVRERSEGGSAIALLLALFVLLPTTALAQTDVEISSRTDRDTVEPGDRLTYEVNVSVAGHFRIEMIDGPDLDDFTVHGRLSAPSYRIVNGDPHRSLHKEFRLRAPNRPGTYTIGAPSFSIGDRRFSPDDQTIEVVDDGRARPAPDDERPDDRVFVDVTLDPDRNPYVGEQLIVDFTLYTHHRQRRLRPRGFDEPALDGFWAENLTRNVRRGRSRVQRYGDLWYRSPFVTYSLFPLSSGSAEIDPVRIPIHRAQVFEDEPEMIVESDPVELDVRPLPDGAPDAFSPANVGSFDFDVSVNGDDDINAGDQLRIAAQITGTGRIDRVGLPAFDIPDDVRLLATDDSHDTWIRDGRISGRKVVEYRLMPLEEGTTELPALEFSYFDPDEEDYITLRSDPVELEVGPGDVPVFADYDDAQRTAAPETNDDPLAELHDLLPPETLSPDSRDTTPLHLWIAAISLAALFIVLFGPALSRPVLRRLSPGFRRRALRRRIEGELRGGDDVPTSCLRALRICLRDGLELPVGALTTDDVAAALEATNVSEALADVTVELVDELVEARYAPASAFDDDDLIERTRATATELLNHCFGADDRTGPGGSDATATLLVAATGLAIAVAASPAPLEAGSPNEAPKDVDMLFADAPAEWADIAEYWTLRTIDEPGDPTHHYNAGTASARAGDLGAARLHLERAHATAPGDRVIRRNLFVVTDAVAADSEQARFHAQRPLAATVDDIAPYLIIALLWVAIAAALLRRLKGRPSSRIAFTALIATILVATTALAMLWLHVDRFPGDAELAVVTADDAQVFEAPSTHSDHATDTPLPAGAAILVTDNRDGWVDAELPSGHNGWLKNDAVAPVTP